MCMKFETSHTPADFERNTTFRLSDAVIYSGKLEK